jgi:protease-4
MKDFLKFTFATVVGIIISTVLLSVVGLIMMAGVIASSGGTETVVKKNSVMVLNLDGVLVERSQDNLFQLLLGDENITYGLDDILAAIKKAKEHKDIKGIYLKANNMAADYASLQEVRRALADFKESGKFVVAYGDTYSQRLYYLTSVADKVVLNPQG